jgi:hypothetical protein
VAVDFGPKPVAVDIPTNAPPGYVDDHKARIASYKGSFDPSDWFTTTQMLQRGWARQWLDMVLGKPFAHTNALLWPKEKALKAEKHPAWALACELLRDVAKRGKHPTKADEIAALKEADARVKAGGQPVANVVEIAPPPQAAPSEWPKSELTADSLTLEWPDGKMVVPIPFLEALRRGMGETKDRLEFAINTVVTDWRAARSRPTKLEHGRNYLLASVRNVLRKLQELERPEQQPVAQEQAAPPDPERVLH